jgi:hypothetical protein
MAKSRGSNVQTIATKMDFSIEEATDIIEILNEAGVGEIMSITMETPSDKWDYSFTLIDSNQVSFYVVMDIAGYVFSVRRGSKDGKVVYREPVDSLYSEEN